MSLHLFSFSDPIRTNYRRALPAYFHINATTSYDVLILRLLTSNLRIQNSKTASTINLQNNYTVFPFQVLTIKSGNPIRTLIGPNTLNDYVRFSTKFYTRNLGFYNNVLQELTFYFSYTSDQQYVTAFVNLYRTLEYLSYSIPMMHASHFGNYLGSFSALRSYFVDAKTSEIAFFELFLNRLFNGTPYLGLTTSFDFSNPDATIATNCYNSFRNLMPPAAWTVSNPATQYLEIENVNLLSLIKNTRNRYFHFAVGGQRNLHTTDLADPDFFFSRVNEQFLNWLSFIYSTVVKENLLNALV